MKNFHLNKALDFFLLPTPDERFSSFQYHPLADGFRALAMLGVMWFHIWQQSWLSPRFVLWGRTFDFTHIVRSGYLLVDVFLLLSG
ncbi:MAG: hypothetical protein IIX93_09725, partial [Clostridia bacterium]|nr:hypothetical protein [Clostridia bacterium]